MRTQMDRKTSFELLSSHPWLSRLFAKLTQKEIEQCREILRETTSMTKHEFPVYVDRLFIGADKPRHWNEMSELLSCANSSLS